MAAKLQQDNVRVMKPRKAKGAKSSGGRKPASVSKPRPGDAPKIPAQPSDADVRSATQNRLIALHQSHRKLEGQMSAAQEVLSGLREQKAQVRASIQNTCVPLAIYDELHKKVTAKTKRADNELYERQRAMAFEAFGLPIGPQPELDFAKVPDAARPAIHWESVGYQDGIDGQVSDPTAASVPPENLQDYMRGYSQAMARNAAGLKELKATPSAAAKVDPPKMVGEDETKAAVKYARAAMAKGEVPAWNGFPNTLAEWTDDHRAVFTEWFEGLALDAEVDILHVGAAAMFDELVAGEDSGDVQAPAAEAVAGEAIAGAAPAGVIYMLSSDEPFESGRQATYKDGQPLDTVEPGAYPVYDEHPFEASAEELAGQAGRPGGDRDAQEQEPAFED